MNATRTLLAGLLLPCMWAGCFVVPGPRGGGVAVVPLLPPIVVLGSEPYYEHSGYHYYYREDGNWSYSQSRGGPWVTLPRDHYPREVRFKDGRAKRNGERDPRHHER